MQAHILREKFLEFFKSKKHRIVGSDSLVPAGDPTVLFTPAGMNQFKKEFLGFDSGFKRAATAQRCLRTDDLDKVGKTSGHHTFFEMLGNFSFGDYFKKEAIAWAWEFLTEELKIKEEKLWVSVYKDDSEAYKIWRDVIKVPAAKILKLGDKENFWPSEAKAKGPNGPCGPCSEIFFDQGRNTGCKRPDCTPACGCGRFVEVWNLVFTQFNRKEAGILEPLPRKNIDTGMGLERLAAVMQGVSNNFQTDLFKPLVNEIIYEVKNDNPENREAVYAVADHIRAIVFAIYDGVLPSNEARGYVVRKIIRKSALHLRSMGLKHPFLYKLVPVLAQAMKAYYPELMQRRENIAEVILAEEKSFISTLNSSDALLKEKFQGFTAEQNPEKAGKIAFQLYDTYGIPLELATDWLDKQGIKISKEAFNRELAGQKRRSKLQSAMKGDVFDATGLVLDVKETGFLGYKEYSSPAHILRIIRAGEEIKKIDKGGESVEIVLDQTPFYGESGGQVGDSGEIVKGNNKFEVTDTRKIGKVIVHIGKVKAGSFKKNDSVRASINVERRLSIARNHTATHLLQAALRKVIGQHVQQQGSLVGEDKFRFDFAHFKDIDKAQLERIEEIVNGYIIDNYPLRVKQMTLSEAKKTGALAFFGEKYEGKVRVVSIGEVSRELCAGTHLDSTGQIGIFKIIQEGSVASGVRRIEAATGTPAYKMIKEEERVIDELSSLLGVPAQRINVELEKRLNKIKELERQLDSQKFNSVQASLDDLDKNAELINGIKLITYVTRNLDMNTLRKTVDLIKEKVNNTDAFIAAGSVNAEDNVMLVFGATADLCSKGLDAGNLIKQVAPEIGGSGGGRKDFAQAGGNKPGNLENAIKKLKSILSQIKL
jgi:alanyl-tRNA synthetase